MKPPAKTHLAAEMAREMPNYPSRTIARFLAQKYPDVFRDTEDARLYVRRVRGNEGAAKHTRAKHALDLRRQPGKQSDGVYPLPEPISESHTDWAVQRVSANTVGIISDIHIPFHDKVALDAAIRFLDQQKPDLILLLGDVVDFYSCSFWDKDPRRRFRLADELEAGKCFLEHIRDRFPKARIIYKEGNHEERLARNVWRDLPELASAMLPDGSPCTDLSTLLGFEDFGVEHIGNKQPILLGEHLYCLHGHEFRTSLTNSVNPARGLYLRTKANALCGDMHQTSHHSDPSIEKVISAWSIGCLCHLRPAYMPLNRWNHGFALYQHHKGAWSVSNHKILHGKVV